MTEIQNPKPVYDLEVRTSQYPAGTKARPQCPQSMRPQAEPI